MSAKESAGEDISDLPDPDLKIILLGDSAVGKSKLIERFLMDEYNPRQVMPGFMHHFSAQALTCIS